MTDETWSAAHVVGETLLRLADVKAETGLEKTSIYQLMDKGQFPRPVRVGGYAVRWKASEIDARIASLPNT